MIKLLKRDFILRTKKNLYKHLLFKQHFYVQDVFESIKEGEDINLEKEFAILDIDWNRKNRSSKLIENTYCYKNQSQEDFLNTMILKIELIFLELSISYVDFLFEVKNEWTQKNFSTIEFQRIYSELRKYILCSSEITVFRVNIKNIESIFKLCFFNNTFVASNPPIIFSPIDDNFVGYFCQYGNFHIYTNNLHNTNRTRNAFLSQGFELCKC